MNLQRLLTTALRTALAVTLGLVILSVVPPASVSAQSEGNGLQENSVSRFEFDPDADVLRVTVTTTIRNVTADRREGNVIRQTYFNGYGAPLPVGADNIVATVDGRSVEGELFTDGLEEGAVWTFYDFPLGRRLFNGQSATVVVTYEHSGFAPRDTVPFRVNDAYVSFLAFGMGDDGDVSLEVVVPAAFELDVASELDEFEAVENDDGSTTYRRDGLDEDYSAIVSMSNNDGLVSTDLEVGDALFELRSWPGDDEWVRFADEAIVEALPELEAMIGFEWPIEEPLAVRQTVEPSQYGYAGWFDFVAGEIAVGEELDGETMIHELSHAWFNDDWFSGLWLLEGFAQAYTAELMRSQDEFAFPAIKPTSYSAGRQPLVDWTRWDTDVEEGYGYQASYWVMSELLDEVGVEAMREVLARIEGELSAYADPSREISTNRSTGWQRIYDLLVNVAGSELVDELYDEFVLNERSAQELVTRNDTAAALEELTARSDTWETPVEIVETLDSWAFERANRTIDEAHGVLDERDELRRLRELTAVDEPDLTSELYAEVDEDFDEVLDLLRSQIEAGNELVEQLELRDGLAEDLGLDVQGIADAAGFAEGSERIAAQIDVLEHYAETASAVREGRSFTQRIGLRDRDLNSELVDVAGLIGMGELVDADAALTAVDDAIDSAADRGRDDLVRWISSAAGVAVVLLAALLIALRVRRRKRAELPTTDPTPVAVADREPADLS